MIRGEIAAREKIIAIEPFRDRDGIGRCRLVMQPKVIAVSPRPMRPFQGWRYLTEDAAPPDLARPRRKRRGDARAAAPRTARSRAALARDVCQAKPAAGLDAGRGIRTVPRRDIHAGRAKRTEMSVRPARFSAAARGSSASGPSFADSDWRHRVVGWHDSGFGRGSWKRQSVEAGQNHFDRCAVVRNSSLRQTINV